MNLGQFFKTTQLLKGFYKIYKLLYMITQLKIEEKNVNNDLYYSALYYEDKANNYTRVK